MTIRQSTLPEVSLDRTPLIGSLSSSLDIEEDLPGSADLPDSDDTPVDNEGQNDIPNGLRMALAQLWADRQDWFFGVDMGIYDRSGQRNRAPTIIPDGFLSLGVTRRKGQFGRSSYVLAEEQGIVPIFALEYLSKTYGGEYDEKLRIYQDLGVLYYLVYNPEGRRKHQKLELYKLQAGQLQQSTQAPPFWLPEIGLGIGLNEGLLSGVQLEWLTWFNAEGIPYPLPEEVADLERQRARREYQRAERECQRADQERQRADQERQRADQERQRAELLAAKLRSLGIDLDGE